MGLFACAIMYIHYNVNASFSDPVRPNMKKSCIPFLSVNNLHDNNQSHK